SAAGTPSTASATCPGTSAAPASSSPSTPRSSPPPRDVLERPPAGSRRERASDGGQGVLLPLDGDVLALQILEHALVAALAADAALLGAAERRGRVGDDAAVEPDHAGVQRLGDAQALGQVGGVDVGDQPVLGVVGQPDRLVD